MVQIIISAGVMAAEECEDAVIGDILFPEEVFLAVSDVSLGASAELGGRASRRVEGLFHIVFVSSRGSPPRMRPAVLRSGAEM